MTAGVVADADHGWLARVLAGDPRAHRVLNLIRELPTNRCDAFLRCSERMAAGMPVADARAMMLQECGRTPA